jgi:hypothetical protein
MHRPPWDGELPRFLATACQPRARSAERGARTEGGTHRGAANGYGVSLGLDVNGGAIACQTTALRGSGCPDPGSAWSYRASLGRNANARRHGPAPIRWEGRQHGEGWPRLWHGGARRMKMERFSARFVAGTRCRCGNDRPSGSSPLPHAPNAWPAALAHLKRVPVSLTASCRTFCLTGAPCGAASEGDTDTEPTTLESPLSARPVEAGVGRHSFTHPSQHTPARPNSHTLSPSTSGTSPPRSVRRGLRAALGARNAISVSTESSRHRNHRPGKRGRLITARSRHW